MTDFTIPLCPLELPYRCLLNHTRISIQKRLNRNFMSRQQILPSRVTAEEVRSHRISELEMTWDLAAEDDHVGQIFGQFARWGGGFPEQATSGKD